MKATFEFLAICRGAGDQEADALVKKMFQERHQTLVLDSLRWKLSDLTADKDPYLVRFFLSQRVAPPWLDMARIQRGQRFFSRYALPIMTLLGGLSLPYCYAGSPGNKALFLSDKMRSDPGKRLADTADFILGVCAPGAWNEKGAGCFHTNKTRLIHAIARYFLVAKGSWNSDWGVPINQEDMAGTNLAFSYLILTGMQKSGFLITEREREDFLYLWRYIGYQLHLHEELLPGNFMEAQQLERAIRKRHFKKSEEGVVLTKELVAYYQQVFPKPDRYFIEAQLRYWLGNEVAGYLGLEESLKDRIVSPLNSWRELSNYFGTQRMGYYELLRKRLMLKNR